MDVCAHESGGGVGGRKRRVLRWAVAVALVVGLAVTIKLGRHHVFPRRFAVVEQGQLYRSGYLEPWPLERVIRKYELETVLSLMTDEPDTVRQKQEEAILQREGVQLYRIGMPGDGCADFDLLDQAADAIADGANRPLLVHCAAGVHRTSAAYAAWRMKSCGWDVERALAEAAEYGVTPRGEPELCRHLRRYYESRVLPARGQDTTEMGRDLGGERPARGPCTLPE